MLIIQNINKKEYSEINYKIGGTDPGGGIIFWLDGNGRGLEITPFDLEVGGNEYSGLGLTVEPFEFDSSVGGICHLCSRIEFTRCIHCE